MNEIYWKTTHTHIRTQKTTPNQKETYPTDVIWNSPLRKTVRVGVTSLLLIAYVSILPSNAFITPYCVLDGYSDDNSARFITDFPYVQSAISSDGISWKKER